MTLLKAFAFCAAATLYAQPSFAAINLGTVGGERIETFSFDAGQVDKVFNFSLGSAASFSVIQTDFTFGGTLVSSLSLLSASPDPTPPVITPPTLLSLSIEAVARIDRELDEAIQRLQAYVRNGDDVAAELQQLRVSEVVARRAGLIALIEDLLNSPPTLPQSLRMAATTPTALEGSGQLGDTLAAGSYSLRLLGTATGPGAGYLTFAVRPTLQGAVPESGTWVLLVAGFGAAGAALRRRKSSAT